MEKHLSDCKTECSTIIALAQLAKLFNIKYNISVYFREPLFSHMGSKSINCNFQLDHINNI